MSMYPSLEDMKFDQMAVAQIRAYNENSSPEEGPMVRAIAPSSATMYPSLGDYMGLDFNDAMIAQNMPEYAQIALPDNVPSIKSGAYTQMVAPLSRLSVGLQRAQVTNGVRECILCKDKDGKVGLRVKPIDNGIFVCLVIKDSPAALAGIRFGDQVLQINGTSVAGFNMEKVHTLFSKSPVNGISVVLRDRPFERTLTLHKDSTKHVGFGFKNGKINNIVKYSSAARNGVLTAHQLLEVEGQNVVGLKDKEITKIIDNSGDIVTITVIPSYIYEHIIKKMSTSIMKELMSHAIPDI